MSNTNLTEDDMSSDAHTTDVSRTSSYLATGSSFEDSLAQSQAASGRFLGAAAGGAVGANPTPGGGSLSSLAERLARAEETVGREHEKGLLYRQVIWGGEWRGEEFRDVFEMGLTVLFLLDGVGRGWWCRGIAAYCHLPMCCVWTSIACLETRPSVRILSILTRFVLSCLVLFFY